MKTTFAFLFTLFAMVSLAYAEQGNFKQCQELCGIEAGCNQCCAAKYNECRNSCYETRQGCTRLCLQSSAQDPERKCEKDCVTAESTCNTDCVSSEFDITACTANSGA